MPVTAAPGGSPEPPAPTPESSTKAVRRPISLSESARLHDLSYDLRAIHSAMLPAPVSEAIAAFNALTSPTPEHARAVLSAILEGCESLLDALLACRLVEGSLELAAHHARSEDERMTLMRDVEGLIAMLAGRLSLGALNTVLQADALGQKRALVRAYRMELLAQKTTATKTAPCPEVRESIDAPWRQWLAKPLGMPKRNGPLALGAAAMVVALPIAGAFAAPAGGDSVPLWSAISVLMAASSAVAVLCSPFRWPAQRQFSSPQTTTERSTGADYEANGDSISYALSCHQSALNAQGIDVSTMDETALAAWIESSGTEIATLLKMARNQSLAANITEDE